MMDFKQNDTVRTRCNLQSHDGETTIGAGSIGRVTVVGIELSDGSVNGIEVLFDNGIYGHYNTTQLRLAPKSTDPNMEDRPEMLKEEGFDPQATAIALVYTLFYSEQNILGNDKVIDSGDVYIVWFCNTLQNWKALVSTDAKDNAYYEVTHNGDKNETYVDRYLKDINVKVDQETGYLTALKSDNF